MDFRKKILSFNKKTNFTLLLIFCLSLFSRLFLLGNFPPSLNRDEAAIGWNAYSILKTGRDEWGQKLPLSFKSFGDYKMPLYIYFTIPFIKVFGLNEFAVRFPSAFFGSLTVLLVYFLVKELFIKNSNHQSPASRQGGSTTNYLPIIASVLLAISPWHLHYSRIAFEANLSLFLMTAGFTFFFWSFQKKWLSIISAIFWSLSFYAYSSAFIFMPPLVFAAFFLYKKKIFTKNKILPALLAVLIFLFGLSHSFYSVWQVSKAKKSITVFSDPTIVDRFNRLRGGYYAQNPILARILLNKFTYFGKIVFKNYLATFSPDFLFISGGGHPWHSIPNFGNFYLIEAIFLIFGVIAWWRLKGKVKWFLAAWLLLAPLASAITVDAPHSTRSLTMIIPMIVLMSLGIIEVVNFFKKKKQKIFIYCLLITVYLLLFTYFLFSYFYIYPRNLPESLMSGFKQALIFTQQKNPDKAVFILNPQDAPYIYTLFHLKISPEKFYNTVEHYGAGIEGFEHVKSFDGYKFYYGLPEKKEESFYIIRYTDAFPDQHKAVKNLLDYNSRQVFTVYEF